MPDPGHGGPDVSARLAAPALAGWYPRPEDTLRHRRLHYYRAQTPRALCGLVNYTPGGLLLNYPAHCQACMRVWRRSIQSPAIAYAEQTVVLAATGTPRQRIATYLAWDAQVTQWGGVVLELAPRADQQVLLRAWLPVTGIPLAALATEHA